MDADRENDNVDVLLTFIIGYTSCFLFIVGIICSSV